MLKLTKVWSLVNLKFNFHKNHNSLVKNFAGDKYLYVEFCFDMIHAPKFIYAHIVDLQLN